MSRFLRKAVRVPGHEKVTNMEPAKKRIGKIIRILRREYPDSRTALVYETPLQILVATILAAQCTDERVNMITPGLFGKYPTAADFANADRASLETEIRSSGFFRNKAKSIIGAAKRIVENFGGEVPSTMEELLTLPGVARKTANIVLSSGFGKAEGIAVDTHVRRLSGRLGLSRQTVPEKIEKDLLRLVPRRDWLDFNSLLVDHGRKACSARQPLCPRCAARKLCPSAVKFFPELKTAG
jgi:endonuclease-3